MSNHSKETKLNKMNGRTVNKYGTGECYYLLFDRKITRKRNEQSNVSKQFTLELESNLISCCEIVVRTILVIFIITNNYHFETIRTFSRCKNCLLSLSRIICIS